MTALTRRDTLATGAAAALAGLASPAWGETHTAAPKAPFVTSDIGTLRTVLVHSVTPQEQPIGKLGAGLIPYAEVDLEAMTRQQAGLMALLRNAGATVIEVEDALTAAIEATKPSGIFATWVETAYPRLAQDPNTVTAAQLLGRDPAIQFQLGPDGTYRHRADRTTSTMWTRDSAFMTPNGLVICNAVSPSRQRENHLLRFVYAHSPLLKDYPVVFDGVEEGMIVEGGDAQMVDRHTLYLGVGNRTDIRTAKVLARRLDMDVLTVQTVEREFLRHRMWHESGSARELRALFLHLDTYFTHVGPKHGLILPYVMEEAHAEDNPLALFIRGARAETRMDEDEAETALAILKDFGRVRLFRRGTGQEDDLGPLKLADYLRTRGYTLTPTGGAPPQNSDQGRFHHFMTVSYPEQRRQATNVVQAVPGRVIAYDGNPYTKAALEADGIKVDTFPARDLWFWHGGPHCLTQPLERA